LLKPQASDETAPDRTVICAAHRRYVVVC